MSRTSANRWRLGIVLIALVTLTLVGARPAQAAASSFTTSIEFPFKTIVFISCANGGAGEFAQLEGPLHMLYHVTDDNTGGIHVKVLSNPEAVSGVGLTTGDRYQATGGTQLEYTSSIGYEETFMNNFRIIGQGPGNNFLIHYNAHVTINANGEVTAEHDNYSTECM